tara:strand:+ start:4667 stop:5434 length:768 start_codon:yes stop_codon:yes gene_type:complete
MIIVVDIGNTSSLFASINEKKIHEKLRLDTRRLSIRKSEIEDCTFDKIKNFINNSNIDTIVLSGVVPQAIMNLYSIINDMNLGVSIDIIDTNKLLKFINVDLENPYEVGDDRIINSIAANDLYEPPNIIIDFGTATTFDVVNSQKAYVGGLICPGINLTLKSLSEGTALLPLIEFKKTEEIIGKSTIGAMESGVYWGYISLVEGIVKKLLDENDCDNANVIATGGYAKVFENDLKCVNYIEEDLTLIGLHLTTKN